MTLRYTFRHLFYGGKIQKERLYKVLEDLDASNTGDGTDISGIKQAIGKASGDGAGGILKDVKDIQDAIGTESTENSILARIKALEEAQNTSGGDANPNTGGEETG